MKKYNAEVHLNKIPILAATPILLNYTDAELAFQEMLVELRKRFPESSGYKVSVKVELVEVTEYPTANEYLRVNFRKPAEKGGSE